LGDQTALDHLLYVYRRRRVFMAPQFKAFPVQATSTLPPDPVKAAGMTKHPGRTDCSICSISSAPRRAAGDTWDDRRDDWVGPGRRRQLERVAGHPRCEPDVTWAGAYLSALWTRFAITRSLAAASTSTGGRSAGTLTSIYRPCEQTSDTIQATVDEGDGRS
jgi:hypothetical protein